jgi:hypothetical protein
MKYKSNNNIPVKLQPKKSLNTSIDEIIADLRKVWALTKKEEIEKRDLIIKIKEQLDDLKK